MENIDLKALFNSPEPDTTEQQKAQPPCVYHCGIQQLEPYRQQERKPYTRVELPEAKKTKQQRIECCYDALDDIEQRIKEHVQEHKAKDHKQEVLELEYTAVVELMRQLSGERKAGGRK